MIKLKFLSFMMLSFALLSFSIKTVQADVFFSVDKSETKKVNQNLADDEDEGDQEEEEERF